MPPQTSTARWFSKNLYLRPSNSRSFFFHRLISGRTSRSRAATIAILAWLGNVKTLPSFARPDRVGDPVPHVFS